MALFPVLVSRSVLIISEKNDFLKVSVSFIATFEDGSNKVINSLETYKKGLLIDSEIGFNNETILTKNTCPLYYKDWTNVKFKPDNI